MKRAPEASAVLMSLSLAALGGCSGWEDTTGAVLREGDSCPFTEGVEPAAAPIMGLRVVGTEIHDSNGERVFLRGVNRSGSEYQCTDGDGVFDGPSDEASVRAIKSSNANAVRVPLNEACWLGLSSVPARFAGDTYKTEILDYVALLQRYGLLPILELHWSAPGDAKPDRLQPMPNADHSADFWRDVAMTFRDNTGVIFEPYNEPYPDRNRDTELAWQCWRDGCTANQSVPEGAERRTYEAVGLQALVDAIRETGAEQLILLGGVEYSNGLSQWLSYKPEDPLDNLAAAWHVYNFNRCRAASCWDTVPAQVAAEFPVVATEIGQDDCEGDFISPLMDWLDQHGSGYLAWSWNDLGACVPASETADGQPWPLITDYACPQPNSTYAAVFQRRLSGPVP